MCYLASNFADINGIVISTATSVLILVTWVFPSLGKKKSQTNTKINHTYELELTGLKRQQKAGLFWA